MLEAEARTKWCPHVQIETMGNRWARSTADGEIAAATRCVGSKCAAWRWIKPTPHDDIVSGYCGLAGKPEIEK